MSERQRNYNGATGHRRYLRWVRLNHSTGIDRQTRRPKRNGAANPGASGGSTRGIAHNLIHPGWLAYRYIIIGVSAFGFTAGISAFIAECVR